MILGQADLAGGLSAAVNDASWSVTLYNVGQIAGLPMTMTAAAAFGRGRTMALAGAGFALSSAAIALSPGLGVFLAARLLQGFFGGALPVLFMVMIMTSLPPGRSQAGGLSLFAIATSVGAGFAAGLSFLLLEAGGWRGLFWCQVAVGGLYAVLAARALPHERGDAIHLRQKDWPSYVFLSVGLGLLVVFLSEGERRYWFDTWWIAAALACGAAATALGVRALAQASRPLLKLSLLRRPSFLGALLLQALFRAGSLLTLSTIPQALIRLEAYGLEQIAGLLIPMATAAAAGALASHLLCGRGHSRAALAAGLFACAIAAGLCTGVSSSWAGENYRIAIVIAGLGQGLFSVAVMRFVAVARNVRVGEYVGVGQRLLAIAPTQGLWVQANLRETQLGRLRPGDRVAVSIDALPGRTLCGRVDGLPGASGAELALLPPDNATGNFTKIVRRFSVRILLDPGQPASERLAAGMSVQVRIALGSHGGGRTTGLACARN